MSDIPLLRKPDGTFVEAQADAEGNLTVVAETTGPGGAGLAEEATLQEAKAAVESVAGTVAAGGVPTPGQPALAVVNVDPAPTFAAAPAEGTELPGIYVAGTAPFLPDRDSNLRPVFIEPSASEIATGVGTISGQLPEDLGGSGGLKVEIVAPLPAGTEAIGTVEVTASALPDGASTEATLATRASEATATSTLAAVDTLEANTDQIEAKLGTLAAQEATTAKDASVDGLEALATTGNATTSAINTKLLAALGTDFSTPVRGTATAVVAQLPSSSTPRGFTLENIDTTNDLWVGTDNTVTTANGFRISPSRARFFDLGNPNALWVISASTTAWQIGATS